MRHARVGQGDCRVLAGGFGLVLAGVLVVVAPGLRAGGGHVEVQALRISELVGLVFWLCGGNLLCSEGAWR